VLWQDDLPSRGLPSALEPDAAGVELAHHKGEVTPLFRGLGFVRTRAVARGKSGELCKARRTVKATSQIELPLSSGRQSLADHDSADFNHECANFAAGLSSRPDSAKAAQAALRLGLRL
jgi:hypothetical protein